MLEKSTATRLVRDALAGTFPDDVKVIRNAATCYGRARDAYVLFNVQHSRWKPGEGLRFCVNTSVLPVRLFEANPSGQFGRHPKEYDSHIFARGRLTSDPNSPGDHWFLVESEEELADLLPVIQSWAEAYWRDRFPSMLADAWYVEQLRALGDHPAVRRNIEVLETRD